MEEKVVSNDLTFNVLKSGDSFDCVALLNDNSVCKCRINICDKTWTISSWYTNRNYINKGFGTKTLKYLMKYLYDNFGMPKTVEYIWNGANEYVYEWMQHNFGAISKCPLAVQKTQSDDDWESHIYYLNMEKVKQYFDFI